MATYWQGRISKTQILAVYHPGDKKSRVINIQEFAFEALDHSHPLQFFRIKPTETTGEGLNYTAGYIDGEVGKGVVRITRVSQILSSCT